jgi:Peptidase inhibitor family I36
MAGSRVPIPLVRRLATLLAMAAIATALSGVAPAEAGGKPMPAGGKPTPLVPSQRSAAAVDRQVAAVLAANPGSRRISATSVLLAPGVVMTVPGPVTAGSTMAVPTQSGGQMVVAAAAADSTCASGWLCMWQHIYRAGARLAFYHCRTENLGNYYISAGNSWRDDISSIWNHQTGGVVSYFYDWKLVGYVRVGSLSAGNYLQDLTRDRAADGGNWNDRIDQVSVC